MIAPSAISMRDPAGQLIRVGDRILRVVPPCGTPNLQALLTSSVIRRFVDAGRVCRTRVLPREEADIISGLPSGFAVLEHERINFVSYPHEWPPEMLFASAELTLDLAEQLLEEGLGLKDATPYNVLFRGSAPVFVDALSLERRDPHDPLWRAYAQFVRTMLLPLLANRRLGMSLANIFLSSREGLEPEEVYRMCSWGGRLRPPMLTLATLPTWLVSRHASDQRLYAPKRMSDPERAQFTLQHLFRSLRKKAEALRPRGDESSWSSYSDHTPSYTDEQQNAKRRELDRILALAKPRCVLDIGCNTGVYSELAATHGAEVVSIDQDSAVVGALWRRVRNSGANVLPLVVNIARPSPAAGWQNREEQAFLERAIGQFDCVLVLALIHHLLVTARIPIEAIVELLSELTTDLAIIEYVGREDPMFRSLLRGRDALHENYNRTAFETAFERRFVREHVAEIPNSERAVYVWRKR